MLNVSSEEGLRLGARRDRRLHVIRGPGVRAECCPWFRDSRYRRSACVIVARFAQMLVETHVGPSDALEPRLETTRGMGCALSWPPVSKSAPVPTRPSVAYSLKRCQYFVLTFLLMADLG